MVSPHVVTLLVLSMQAKMQLLCNTFLLYQSLVDESSANIHICSVKVDA